MIESILKERKEQSIHIDELNFLLNNRTKNTKFMNNNKKKNIHNFIKVVYGGLIHFLDDYEEFMQRRVNDGYMVELNNLEKLLKYQLVLKIIKVNHKNKFML